MVLGGNIEDFDDNACVELYNVRCSRTGNKLRKVLSFLKLELLLLSMILKRVERDDLAFFWIADKMLLPFWAAKLKRARTYYFLMGNVGNEGKKTLFRNISEKMIVYMAEHADYICVESLSVIDCWNIRIKPEKIKIIHLFVEGKAEPLYEQKENTIGMVCRLVEGKHVLESIKAFAMFSNQKPNWKLQIVGSGMLRDDCENLIKEFKLEHKVELLGWVEHSKLPSIVAKWKLLLFPTDAEGLPNGLIETMFQGVPAIASPVGGIIDVIEDWVNGWILSDCSVDSICEAMIRALSSQNFLSIAKAAEKIIVQKFTFSASVDNLREQLKEVLL
ncbi:glycosyl transferases group 1 family protein [Desulfosporosinus sp. OT]|nr:glycosyl transferases group 1 family protein [Desulfosporosinus sp. OT]